MTTSLEDVKPIEIEVWKTLNTAASPTKLENGMSPDMKNVWVDEKPGSVITANGFTVVGTLPSNNPPTFGIDYFKASTGVHQFVVSDNETVWWTTDFQNFTSIITGLSGSFQLRGKIIRDKLWLTNGSDDVRTWDQSSVTVLNGGGGTPDVPTGRYIEYHDERVWLLHTPSDRSGAFFSALSDSSGTQIAPDSASAWPAANELQISEGDADFGTGMSIYRGALVFFKQYSIWRLIGYDEYTYDRVKTRASTGTRFQESVQELDSILHLVGVDGIYVFDGDESLRISDLIDPAQASQTAFGFNQLQQPNTNNQFWQTAQSVDWNAGTVPSNLDVDDAITLEPADDSQADFAAGVTQTNLTTSDNPGAVQLLHTSSGVSNQNLALDQTASISGTAIGSASYFTDGEFTNSAGIFQLGTIAINLLSSSISITRIVLKSFQMESGNKLYFKADGVLKTPSTVSGAPYVLNGDGSVTITDATTNPLTAPRDITFNFVAFTAAQITLRTGSAPNTGTSKLQMTEFQVFSAAYNTTGKFTSKSLDLGATPNAFGGFNATVTTPTGTSLTYFTQSSADGSSWDSEVAVTNGGTITSTVRRYLRWGANFTSDGTDTPTITDAWLPSQFISPVHDTGGSIFAWGPIESDRSTNGQTITYYYRTGTTSPNCLAASWNVIVPGGVINANVANQFVQFKIEIDGGTDTQVPTVLSVTINWVVGSGTQPNTLQNVASTAWRNRYWLAAAGPGSETNNTILLRGKKTFGSPWMLKDWPILFFARFYDGLYGGSSEDGSIFRLDTGYSKDGEEMDSYFETGDFVFGGFQITIREVLVEVERMGPYTLSVGVSNDRGTTFDEKTVDLTVSATQPSFTKQLNFDVTGDRIRFRVRINGVDKPFEVHRLIAYAQVSKFRGSIN